MCGPKNDAWGTSAIASTAQIYSKIKSMLGFQATQWCILRAEIAFHVQPKYSQEYMKTDLVHVCVNRYKSDEARDCSNEHITSYLVCICLHI